MESEKIKQKITERWLEALDHLISLRKIKGIRDFDRLTGIKNQRISMMRSYIRDPEKARNSFANSDYIFILNVDFGVNLDFIFHGNGPILKSEILTQNFQKEIAADTNDLMEIRKRIALLEEGQKILFEIVSRKK